MFRFHALSPTFEIRVIGSPLALPAHVEAAVAQVWEEQVRVRAEPLFNGPAYSLLRHAPDRLEVRPIEYRHIVAARQSPALAGALGLRPVAVTGVMRSPDGLVLGRRGPHMALFPGRWELAPAGGLSHPDAAGQLLEELEEEIGLDRARVSAPRALGVTEDCEGGVHEILLAIETDAGAAELASCHGEGASDEYDRLAVVPQDGLRAFLARHAADAVPGLADFVRFAGLL